MRHLCCLAQFQNDDAKPQALSVSNVGSDRVGEGDRWKQGKIEHPSGRCVWWVVLARDITCVEMCASGLCDVVFTTEDDLGVCIFAGAFPPPFDVVLALEMALWAVPYDECLPLPSLAKVTASPTASPWWASTYATVVPQRFQGRVSHDGLEYQCPWG